MNLLEAALNYAREGIPVFPVHGINDSGACTCGKSDCTHPGKHPINKGGHKNATADEQQINQWWNKHPQANIGIPTDEASKWYVVDVDKEKGIESYRKFLAENRDDVPTASLKVHTGGGWFSSDLCSN
ncbi:bifunctional DNA primase/polymerase [Nitrosomonas communis]|uniref:Bifunctional DNA primase/polymerase, N-terminal n=1 Tax=Nitrosomonas communis TaxID=44574 RepID=A0A1I4TDB0_9PROT|nr:bifunctional DNA primase/polymerase [Nitrosomonas communis]SFM74550.1 Bifunctional DNA primase/polymerase, N-terminal [Nitrosomonas communis]